MSDLTKKALCCICGALRTCRRPRNRKGENYWLRNPVDRSWHRETGELKCSECNRVTVHAIVTGDDHAENIHKVAIGWRYTCLNDEDHQRIRERWRQGLPRNPFTQHMWWISDEDAARNAGETHFLAICKARIPVLDQTAKERGDGASSDEFVAPHEYPDVSREDHETGLWWYDGDCVDCLNRANAIALSYKRKALQKSLSDVVERVSTLDAQTVAALLKYVQAADSEASEQ